MAGDFTSAGVTVDDVMAGINDASGSVDTQVWTDPTTAVKATTGAMAAGEEAAKAQADAANRTADTTKAAEEKNRDQISKTAQELRDRANGKYDFGVGVKLHVDDSEVVQYAKRTIDLNGVIHIQGSTRTAV